VHGLNEPLPKKKRGRPATDLIDPIRTRLWFLKVILVSGLPSAYAVEMALDGDRVRKRSTDVSRPHKWDGYESGDTVPRDKPGPRNSIDQAEGAFPNTAARFRSPIWAMLKGEQWHAQQIEQALACLQPTIVATLFETVEYAGREMQRLKAFDSEIANQLLAVCDFDALVAIVLLVHLSEVIASPELRTLVLHTYLLMQPGLRILPDLAPFSQELLRAVDLRCKHWTFASSNKRLDIVILSEALNEIGESLESAMTNK
jgi:hypothetical protein